MASFHLDLPESRSLDRVTSFAGWEMPEEEGAAPSRLVIRVDGEPVAGTVRALRPDVGAVFPDRDRAGMSGWLGDLVLPPEVAAGDSLEVSVVAEAADGEVVELFSESFEVAAPHVPAVPRPRDYDLEEILRNPGDDSAGADFEVAGVPHFHPEGELPVYRLSESGPTHPYGDRALEIIGAAKEDDELVLDFGAGIKGEGDLHGNVVNLEAVHFRNVDVVSTQPVLPFPDAAFGAVVSQAVFEHLHDPFESARQIRRVLRPGGVALIDTAFMQPYHGDPHHYFNMTLSGLREVMEGFEVLEAGVQPHQQPSYGLIMQLEAVVPFMRAGLWSDRLGDLLENLRRDGGTLDEALGSTGRALIPAGVYVVARRPESG